MSKITIKPTKADKTMVSVLKDGKNMGYILLRTQSSNCKLYTIESIPSIIENSYLTRDEKIEAIRLLFRRDNSLMYFTHIIREAGYKFLKENFDLAYCVKVPVGYNNGYQYHICIINKWAYGYRYYFKDRVHNDKSECLTLWKNDVNNDKLKLELDKITKDNLKTPRGVINRLKRVFNIK